MTRYAFLFPGQGSQYVGMGEDLAEFYPIVSDLFSTADHALGFSLSSLMFNGPEDVLMETVHSQLAIFLHSLAVVKILESRISPSIVSGLSLGEYTALVASHRVSLEDGLSLIKKRGELMNEACTRSPGAMAALLGLTADAVKEGIASLGEGIAIANYNAPKQIVIAGVPEKIDEAITVFQALGVKKVVKLKVQGAFHTKLMQSAQDGLAPHIYNLVIQESKIPLMSHVDARFLIESEEIRESLARQTASPTLWYQSCYQIEPEVDVFLEVGPGKVLTGLNRSIGISKPTYSLGTVESIEKFLEGI
ncbi:ACP S-malonyltransferase [Chlamydia pecorum]|uniref:Malonyl CoA-acyl carrier protein transacylase n=1 Tax=Chlamydia pecorum (strain ATCC VR-628 / DSM 29919 / E58) TaxID=331635 RepID=A0AA34WI59_CHLPE|nr:ACP S-malonyltransferase [Chlamydia pecorum]AEB41783.1 malonyl CoA-acyl carrier protein transacylase [Chlamydia pecorum E58]UFP06426.1 ACP S-malonyltransferase [Chlamydia pecorum]UJT77139.1 malonyl CoA-acyl carrier protein transacylase [Chlamydia pecorum]